MDLTENAHCLIVSLSHIFKLSVGSDSHTVPLLSVSTVYFYCAFISLLITFIIPFSKYYINYEPLNSEFHISE